MSKSKKQIVEELKKYGAVFNEEAPAKELDSLLKEIKNTETEKKEDEKKDGDEKKKEDKKDKKKNKGDNGLVGKTFRGNIVIADENVVINGVKRVRVNNSAEIVILTDEELKELKKSK